MRHLFCLLLLPACLFGQNSIGLPDVITYSRQVYNAGLQNWDIAQDQKGIIYVANNEGLLSFDGRYWKLFPLPNKTIVRSVKVGPDNNIYVGGQDEVGYFAPDRNGRLQYTSLVPVIPAEDRAFGDVWDISVYRNSIFFRTPNRIFKFTNGSASVFRSATGWSYLGLCQNRLYAHDYKLGLMYLGESAWIPVSGTWFRDGDPVTGIVQTGADSLVVTTYKKGLHRVIRDSLVTPLHTPDADAISNERIYAITSVNHAWMAMATSKSGVYILDRDGKLIQRFSKNEGIQNNNILSIFLDRDGNLWLGLDNGIDFIAYNSAIKRIIPAGQDGAGYTALLCQGRLYAGTSGGLFEVALEPGQDLSYSRGNFTPVANTTGQTWGLAYINNTILLGHHEGVLEVRDHQARPLPGTTEGYWNFVPLSPIFPTTLVAAGHYRGLNFLHYDGGTFSIGESIPGFSESSRFIALDKEENIWISHPYHGVTKATKGRDGKYVTRLYTQREGLPSTLNNHIYKIGNEVLVATEKGVYAYDGTTDRFAPSPFFRRLLGDQSIRYLKEDTEGNIWFIHEKNPGVLNLQPGDTSVTYLPELNHKLLSGFEFIYPVDTRNIFIGSEKGFFHINYEKYRKTIPTLSVLIRSVLVTGTQDSLLYGGYTSGPGVGIEPEMEISSNWNTIRFEYASPLFGQQANLEFSYRLKGIDDKWSPWSGIMEKEFTHLPPGHYKFEVRVRNNLGNESAPGSFSFTILPPWYKTVWAYGAYLVLALIGLYLLYKWQRRKFLHQQVRHEEEQRKLQYLHQLEIDKAENELITLRNEKLQADIDFKNSELATTAMHLVQKGELLSRVKVELNQLLKNAENEKTANEIKKMIRVLGEDEKMDKDWESFAQHFDKVHSDFLVQLKEKHPAISANEMKLCAYLRMNLSSKEIAQLMNISVRGVEISRYRLRKKLGIPTETNLFDYLINIK